MLFICVLVFVGVWLWKGELMYGLGAAALLYTTVASFEHWADSRVEEKRRAQYGNMYEYYAEE
jgi:hypothetical protein